MPESELLHNLENVFQHLREGTRDLPDRSSSGLRPEAPIVALFMARRRAQALLPLRPRLRHRPAADGVLPGASVPRALSRDDDRLRRLRWRRWAIAAPAEACAGRRRGAARGRCLVVPAAARSRRRWSSKRSGRSPMRAGREQVTAAARSIAATTRRCSRAWVRSDTTCRRRRMPASRCGDFLHEGNGDLWTEALKQPRLSVRWILMEEWPKVVTRWRSAPERDPGVSGWIRAAGRRRGAGALRKRRVKGPRSEGRVRGSQAKDPAPRTFGPLDLRTLRPLRIGSGSRS